MTINCNGNLIDLTTPRVMGILNITPDSFYDGGKFNNIDRALQHVEKMVGEGADFIDIGAYSSKPGAETISQNEELARIVPVINAVINRFPDILISVDTFRSEVAKACVDLGAVIINDISAGSLDENMMPTVADLRVPFIMMHMRGNPQTMQQMTRYDDIVMEMLFYFSQKVAVARSFGISDLIIDPGFGFAKTLEQNYEVLSKLKLFKTLELPLLVGLSRKSMVYKPINATAAQSLNGTTALHMDALRKGTRILRVHDVKEAVECIKLSKQITDGGMAHSSGL